MKKLALALVCFASVAFFASCVKTIDNPEPSIAVLTGENYVYDGQTVDIGQNYTLGFRAASNSQTMKELATFKLNVKFTTLDDTETKSYDSIINVSGTEYTFEQVLNFGLTNTEESRELVAKAIFTATITDVDGKMNSTTINLNINQPAVDLEPRISHGSEKAPKTALVLPNTALNGKAMARKSSPSSSPLLVQRCI